MTNTSKLLNKLNKNLLTHTKLTADMIRMTSQDFLDPHFSRESGGVVWYWVSVHAGTNQLSQQGQKCLEKDQDLLQQGTAYIQMIRWHVQSLTCCQALC